MNSAQKAFRASAKSRHPVSRPSSDYLRTVEPSPEPISFWRRVVNFFMARPNGG